MDNFKTAAAFARSASRLRMTHADRIVLLKQAGGLSNLVYYLESEKKEARPRESILNHHLKAELGILKDLFFPTSFRVLEYRDEAFPQRLREISRPPSLLFISGAGEDLLNRDFVVGLVGSRKPTDYGREVTCKLARELAVRKIPVLSGGARGIDGIAHQSVLAAGGQTAAVLGSGLDRIYPPEHQKLFSEIEKEGLLITEYPPGTPPRPGHFPARNRILAGLCDALIVTEASEGSGTLITAGFAADYGREVLAVPGSILTGSSRSCHTLIREGAALIESVSDIPGMEEKKCLL